MIWDLAPHDLSIMDYVIKEKPEAIVATGEKHLNGLEDIAFITIYFPNNVIAHINVNWLSPVKVRTTLIGGEKKMLVWNDLEADEKIKVYDKGVRCEERAKACINCWSATARATCGRRRWNRSRRCGRSWRTSWMHHENKKPFNDGVPACGWCGCSRPPKNRCESAASW